MLIQDRIQLIIKANNESPSSFADKVGIKRSNLSHVLSGRNNPSLDFLAKIISSFPNVNASWLITGETREEKQVEVNTSQETKQTLIQSVETDRKEIEKIICFYKDGTFDRYDPSMK